MILMSEIVIMVLCEEPIYQLLGWIFYESSG